VNLVKKKEKKKGGRTVSIDFRDAGLLETLRRIKWEFSLAQGKRLTWDEFLRLLVMCFYIARGEFFAPPPRDNYESWRRVARRFPLRVVRVVRVSTSLVRDSYREWVKKYAGFEVYGAVGVRGYDTITLWIARSGDALTLIDVKTNFLNPLSREEYAELVVKTLREALRRLCVERGVCSKLRADPEMPLDQYVLERIHQEFKSQ
jgi:hypothetical protein